MSTDITWCQNDVESKSLNVFSVKPIKAPFQWVDEEPYSIQELFKKYESEETEVNKDKLWAKFKIREELESWWGVEGGIDEDGIKNVLNIIDQLNEPEVLSQEWVDNNVVHVRGLGDIIEAEAVENIIVPNQGLPVIPKFVADWIEENRERYENNFFSIGQDLYDDCIQPDVSDWVMENEEKFVGAWFGVYEIED